MNENNENIYAAPKSEVIEEIENSTGLASRWSRLGASFIDAILMSFITLPTMYFTGGFEGITTGKQPSLIYGLAMGLLGIIVFALINGVFLARSGQTLGKIALKIKVVDLNGEIPKINPHFLKRYAMYFLLGQIPVIGQLLSTINILFIFSKEKQCLHDRFASTRVVNC